MKYNPIGTTFKEGNVLLLVQESLGSLCTCTGCYYVAKDKNGHQIYRGSCCTHGHVCTPYYRKDKKHVVFKKNPIRDRMKKIVFKPGPVFLDTGNGERKNTDMVVIGIRGSLYQKGFGYVIRNIITSEIMTIDIRFWPSNWVCNVFTEYKEEK